MPSRRRTLASVTPDDASTSGRPRLWAFGIGWIARAADVSRASVRHALHRGRFDPADPLDVVRWVLERRGFRDEAALIGRVVARLRRG